MDFIIIRRGGWAQLPTIGKASFNSLRVRSSRARCRRAMQLVFAAAVGCARPPAASSHGTVEVSLTAAEAAGTPQRVHGELTFSGVDNGLVRSASTRSVGARELLEVRLPAGRYTLGLNTEAFVESLEPPAPAAPAPTQAWLHPGRPPLLRVTEGQVTRVHFELVAAEPPRWRAGNEPDAKPSRSTRMVCAELRDRNLPGDRASTEISTCQLAKSYLP